jgi:hypothetical protein
MNKKELTELESTVESLVASFKETTPEQIATKYLGAACSLYTLDGTKPAHIERSKSSACIVSDDGTMRLIVNWQTVARKMESDKLFYSC